MHRAIFLDRDGTLIEERGYICRLNDSDIFSFSFEALRLMKQAGFKVMVVTNQSSIARGICSRDEVETLHSDIRQECLKRQTAIDGFYYCPFHPEGTIEEYRKNHPWRKPGPGMIQQACLDFDIDPKCSYMIGDDLIDIETGKNAGCKTILVLTGKGMEMQKKITSAGIVPGMITGNILTAIRDILDVESKKSTGKA